jgi:hypothetical protein
MHEYYLNEINIYAIFLGGIFMKITKKLAAVGAAVMMMASISAMGVSATSNPYTYGTNPVVHGSATVYSGNRYVKSASTSTSTNMTVGAHVTQYYYNSSGTYTSYGTGDSDDGVGAVAKASVITPSGGKYSTSVHSHSKNGTTFATYTLNK